MVKLEWRKFEEEIEDMIKATSLGKYSFHQLSIKRNKYTLDNVIVLPNKIVVVEVKTRTAEDIKIFEASEAIKMPNHSTHKVFRNKKKPMFFDSMVQQTLEYCHYLNLEIDTARNSSDSEYSIEIQHDNKVNPDSRRVVLTSTIKIEPLICIEAPKVSTYQTKVPIVTKQGLYHYLKTLEDELSFYEPKMVDEVFKKRTRSIRKKQPPTN